MWVQTMESPSLRWKAMAGFLVVIFFISETSALVCYQFISFQQLDSQGNVLTNISSSFENVTCSPDNNACIDAQLELSIISHSVFVSYRGCDTTKDADGGKESTTSGDEYFAVEYNASYCHHNLCNVRTAIGDASNTPRWVTEATKPSNSSQCYSGLNFHESEITLERVTCHGDSDQCYQGNGNITAGHTTLILYIRSCQSTCAVPQRQVFGPIGINIPEGACCLGSDCNKKENAVPTQNNRTWEAPDGSYSEGAANHTTNFTSVDIGDDPHLEFYHDDYSDDDDTIVGTAWPTLHPRAQGPSFAKGASLQLSPLLLVLGITVLGLWW